MLILLRKKRKQLEWCWSLFCVLKVFIFTLFVLVLLLNIINHVTTGMDITKSFSRVFYSDITVSNTWDVSGLHLCDRKERSVSWERKRTFRTKTMSLKYRQTKKDDQGMLLSYQQWFWIERQGRNDWGHLKQSQAPAKQGKQVKVILWQPVFVLRQSTIKHCDFGRSLQIMPMKSKYFGIYGPISVLAAQVWASGDDGNDPGEFWPCVHQGRALCCWSSIQLFFSLHYFGGIFYCSNEKFEYQTIPCVHIT